MKDTPSKEQKISKQGDNTMSKTTAVSGGAFPCAQCTKAFKSLNAVRMHVSRVHTGAIKVPNQRTKMSEEERLAKKRAYNRKWRMRKGMKVRPLAQKQNGSTWTPERRAKFNKTWKEKKKSNNMVGEIAKIVQDKPLEDPRAFINCCPNCGTNLTAYYLAAKAAHKYA